MYWLAFVEGKQSAITEIIDAFVLGCSDRWVGIIKLVPLKLAKNSKPVTMNPDSRPSNKDSFVP